MSEKNSIANKKIWAKVPKQKRSEIARKNALIRWQKASKEDRKIQGMHLTRGRIKVI